MAQTDQAVKCDTLKELVSSNVSYRTNLKTLSLFGLRFETQSYKVGMNSNGLK